MENDKLELSPEIDPTAHCTPPNPADFYEDPDRSSFKLGELIEMDLGWDAGILGTILPKIGTAAIVGRPDSGKSMFVRELALSIAMGRKEYIGLPLKAKRGRAMYVITEDNKAVTRQILSTQLVALNSKLKGQLEVGTLERGKENLTLVFAEDMTPQELLNEIETLHRAEPVDLIVIDSFGDVFSARDTNSNSQVREALKPFASFAHREELLIVFVSHINKSAYNQSPDQAHVQGAGAFAQKVRVILDLRVNSDDPLIKYLAVTKGNLVPAEMKRQAIEISFDDALLVYEATGRMVNVNDVGRPIEQGVAWEIVFGDRPQMHINDIVRKIGELTGLREDAARKKVYAGLMPAGKKGFYLNPRFTREAAEHQAEMITPFSQN